MTTSRQPNSIAIIGGDYRHFLLYQNLQKKGFPVTGIALFNPNVPENAPKHDGFSKITFPESDIWITGIPFTKDKKHLFTASPNHQITIDDFLNHLSKTKAKLLIGGSFPKEVVSFAREHQIPCNDLLKNTALTIDNAVPTAEGAIFHAIKESPYTLHNNKALVLGFGTCGKTLALKLRALDAKVTVCARKEQDFAFAQSLGFETTDYQSLPDILPESLFIFNTVPALVLTRELLAVTNNHCLIIDIASLPGGCDDEAGKNLNKTIIHALGLPGKFSPQTAADLLERHILKLI